MMDLMMMRRKIGTGPLFIQIVAAFDHDENVADDEDGVGGVCDGDGCSV